MGLCVLYYVEYSLYNVKKVGFFLSGLELHFKPIKEGIENLTFPPTQPIGKEEEEEEEEENIGEIAKKYLNRPSPDTTFVKEKVFIISVTSKLLSFIIIL